MALLDTIEPDRVRRLRRTEYDHLVELGAFADERVELLHGVIVRMSPQGTRHAWCIRRLTQLLVPPLVGRADVQVQLPLAADDESEPEPDLSVVPVVESLDDHPDRALLVIEVAESSLRYDLGVKVPLYAAAGVPEVWVIDVARGVVQVHRGPTPHGYDQVSTIGRSECLSPLFAPDLSLATDDFLPG
jgi:Uma2 family endonuclease